MVGITQRKVGVVKTNKPAKWPATCGYIENVTTKEDIWYHSNNWKYGTHYEEMSEMAKNNTLVGQKVTYFEDIYVHRKECPWFPRDHHWVAEAVKLFEPKRYRCEVVSSTCRSDVECAKRRRVEPL